MEQQHHGIERTIAHLPLCTPTDAANLGSYFANQYLDSCRAVTSLEAVGCLKVLRDVVDSILEQLLPPEVANDELAEHESAMAMADGGQKDDTQG